MEFYSEKKYQDRFIAQAKGDENISEHTTITPARKLYLQQYTAQNEDIVREMYQGGTLSRWQFVVDGWETRQERLFHFTWIRSAIRPIVPWRLQEARSGNSPLIVQCSVLTAVA